MEAGSFRQPEDTIRVSGSGFGDWVEFQAGERLLPHCDAKAARAYRAYVCRYGVCLRMCFRVLTGKVIGEGDGAVYEV